MMTDTPTDDTGARAPVRVTELPEPFTPLALVAPDVHRTAIDVRGRIALNKDADAWLRLGVLAEHIGEPVAELTPGAIALAAASGLMRRVCEADMTRHGYKPSTHIGRAAIVGSGRGARKTSAGYVDVNHQQLVRPTIPTAKAWRLMGVAEQHARQRDYAVSSPCAVSHTDALGYFGISSGLMDHGDDFGRGKVRLRWDCLPGRVSSKANGYIVTRRQVDLSDRETTTTRRVAVRTDRAALRANDWHGVAVDHRPGVIVTAPVVELVGSWSDDGRVWVGHRLTDAPTIAARHTGALEETPVDVKTAIFEALERAVTAGSVRVEIGATLVDVSYRKPRGKRGGYSWLATGNRRGGGQSATHVAGRIARALAS